MCTHVQQRLEQRVLAATADVAFELLRDASKLRGMLASWFTQQAAETPSRVALPLGREPDAPHLVVANNGHGVTCLGAGMTLGNTPSVPFAVVQDYVSFQRDRVRVGRAVQKREELEEHGLTVRRMIRHAYRFTRREFDLMRTISALMPGEALGALESMEDLHQHARKHALPPDKVPTDYLQLLWRRTSAACVFMMAGSEEARMAPVAIRATASCDPLVSHRGLWLLTNDPQRLITFATDFAEQTPSAQGWAALQDLLNMVCVRWPEHAAAITRLDSKVTAALAPAGETGSFSRWDEASAVEQMTQWIINHTVLACAREAPPALAKVIREAQGQERVTLMEKAHGPGSLVERAARIHPCFAEILEKLDPLHELHARPRLQPMQPGRCTSRDTERVEVWRDLLGSLRLPMTRVTRHVRWLLTLAPIEALVPDVELDPAWTMHEGVEYLKRYVFRPFLPPPSPSVTTVRKQQADVGRNEPCSCGSGKKYKKCCGLM